MQTLNILETCYKCLYAGYDYIVQEVWLRLIQQYRHAASTGYERYSKKIEGNNKYFDLLFDTHSQTICLFTECKPQCSMHEFKTMGSRTEPILYESNTLDTHQTDRP